MEEEEEWRSVVGLDGRYEVSSMGRLRSVGTRKRGPGYDGDGHYYFTLASRVSGYPVAGLTVNGKTRQYYVHSMVAEAFLCPRPDGLHANHKNANRCDNRPENLEWVTPRQNLIHGMMLKSRKSSKLSNEDVARIQAEPVVHGTMRRLADEYGVSIQLIWYTIRKRLGPAAQKEVMANTINSGTLQPQPQEEPWHSSN